MSEKTHPIRKLVAVCVVFVVSLTGVLLLKNYGFIPDWSVPFLLLALVLFAIVIYAFDRLEELNLRQGSIRLREVKEAEERIYAKEKVVQDLMLTLADLAVMDSLNVGRLTGTLFSDLLRQWREKRIQKILELVQATPDQRTSLQRFVPLYQAVDRAHQLEVPFPEREKAAEPYNQQLIALLRSEISPTEVNPL
jgi:hypothetical protein